MNDIIKAGEENLKVSSLLIIKEGSQVQHSGLSKNAIVGPTYMLHGPCIEFYAPQMRQIDETA